MRLPNLALILVLTVSVLMIGCFSEDPETNSNKETKSTKANASASNKPNQNTNNPIATETVAPPKETKIAVTLKPVVDAYCAAINKGDDASLKKIFSRSSWKALSKDARVAGTNSVAKYLSETEQIGDKCQVVNERISGKLAEATVINESYPNGVRLKFVNESGEWKMTNQSADFEAVRNSTKK